MSVTFSGGITFTGGGFSFSPPPNYQLFAWGGNFNGLLGQNDEVYRSSPVQIGTGTNWSKVASGRYHNLATKLDGTLWGIGRGLNGQLGDNTYANRSSPIQVGALTNWSNVSAAYYQSYGIKTDGTLWSWGYGGGGQLGLNSVASIGSPAQIGTLTTWSKICSSNQHAAAIKTDGTLWAWGGNNFGQLGQNNTSYRSSPVQVGTNTNWYNVSSGDGHLIATTTDGKLWAWGRNNFGQLGQSNTIYRSSPVQVGILTDWSNLGIGGDGSNSSFGFKNTNALWGWGYNGFANLGLNDTTNKSSPVQLGTDTNWTNITTSGGIGSTTIANKTIGQLWIWGYNNKGQLGQNNTTPKSSPIQVGTGTTWSGPLGVSEISVIAIG